jgi:F-type H+-transporting ATPase subunit gamma
MSNSLREVKSRIESTKKTSQITKAMNMVSASKLRRSEKVCVNYQSFLEKTEDLAVNLINSNIDFKHPMLEERPIKKTGYIIVTSDRGLAGGYNVNVCKKLKSEVEEKNLNKEDFVVGVIGKKGYGNIVKYGYNLLFDNYIILRDDIIFNDILPITNEFIKLYNNKEIDKLVVIYTHYHNKISQEVICKQILPINLDLNKVEKSNIEYVYDQGIKRSVDLILPMYVENMIYGLILNAKTSEHACRMASMKKATDNANEVIDKLGLLYNRARQQSITNELIDIIGGANAVE